MNHVTFLQGSQAHVIVGPSSIQGGSYLSLGTLLRSP